MKKAIITILILLILGGGGYFGYNHFFNKKDQPANKKVYTDKIKGFDYKLEKRDTKLYKSKFAELKKVLESDKIDYKKYAKLIAQLYVIDLYTLDNKVTKYDVGSTEFIYPDALENYELKVKDTLYKYVEDNSDKKRKQKLPEVSNIKVESIEESTFDYKVKGKDDETETTKTLDSYVVKLSWEYKEDLSYEESATLIIVKSGKKLYVIEQSDKDNKEESSEE